MGLVRSTRPPVPVVRHDAEVADWANDAELEHSAPRTQHPIAELLAEHQLMRDVLDAMLAEATRLAGRQSAFRLDFWSPAVDFVGNFYLLFHFRKEMNHLFPMVARHGFQDAVKELDQHQQRDIDLTLDLCDAVQEADFEKVMRLVSVYAAAKRLHIEQEEHSVILPVKERLTPAELATLRTTFDELERKAMPEKGRKEYLDIARKLIRDAGLSGPSAPVAASTA